MFEDVIEEKTTTPLNVRTFYCHDCSFYVQTAADVSSVDCPNCGKILLEALYFKYPIINKHNDIYGTTVSC